MQDFDSRWAHWQKRGRLHDRRLRRRWMIAAPAALAAAALAWAFLIR